MGDFDATTPSSHVLLGVPEPVEKVPAELRAALELLAKRLVDDDRIVLEPPEDLVIPRSKHVAVPIASLAVTDEDIERLGPELVAAIDNAVAVLKQYPSVASPCDIEPPPPVICGVQHKWLGKIKFIQ